MCAVLSQYFLVYLTVGVIGLRNESFMVNESDGSITVYVEFLSPDEISADIIVDVIIKTENGTAFGKLFTPHSPYECSNNTLNHKYI